MFAHLVTNARDRNTHFNAFTCVDTAADFVTFFFFSRTQTKQQIETIRCNCISSNSRGSGKNEQIKISK